MSILLRVTTMNREGQSQLIFPIFHQADWGTDGVELEVDPALSGYNEQMDSVDWLIRIPLNLIKHEWGQSDEDPTSSDYNHKGKL